MNRRAVLTWIGTGGMVGLAGCQDALTATESARSGRTTSDGPTATPQPSPRTASARATPTDVFDGVALDATAGTVTEPVSLDVTARNTTSRRRPFRTRLRLATARRTEWFLVELPGVEPDGSRTATVSLGVQPSAGEYELSLPDYGVTATTTVRTASGGFGTELSSRDASLTVSQPRVRLGDLVDGELILPDEDRLFVEFPVEGGRADGPVAPAAIRVDTRTPAFASAELVEGQYGPDGQRGSLLYELPREQLDAAVTATTSGTSRPEFRWTGEPPAVPTLQFGESPATTELTSGIEDEFSITARNTGSLPAVFAATVRGPGGTPTPVGRTTVEPDETATLHTSLTQPTLGAATYTVESTAGRIRPTVTGVPVQRRLGESFTTAAGLVVSADRITDPFETLRYEVDSGERATTAGDDRTFYAARFVLQNREPSDRSPGGTTSVGATAPVGSVQTRWFDTSGTVQFTDPVSGPQLALGEGVPSQTRQTGWVLFQTDADVDRADLSVRFVSTNPENGFQRAAAWQPTD